MRSNNCGEHEETMNQGRLAAAIMIMLFSMQTPAISANFRIDNPASNIYNPAAHMDDVSPIAPPTQPVPAPPAITKKITAPLPAEQIKGQSLPRPKNTIPARNYNFKTVGEYLNAAKKAFIKDNYIEFLSVTEDALRRIRSGTLRAPKISEQKLAKYKAFGYGLLADEK